ncbi:MAG: type II toxin-antitoxin system VapC family toxin [Rhodocyclaceae bacterium]|nr:type II toxin-antitoxin system VapC family toxin [Rhodocyclaceae bacterium]MBX3670911.1 type II toxin-antitoxin system VapC family toxin [Rhodocyclaceae bacterium]
MLYLLDTNICIHLIQASPPQVLARFAGLRQGEVLISAVTYAELCHGVERYGGDDRARAERALARFAARIPVMPFDTRAAERYGLLAAATRVRRRDALDRLIAAHALQLGAVLVTNNEADFRDYPGLTLENWVAQP